MVARIGNDIRVNTSVTDKAGQAITLTGAQLEVSLRSALGGTIAVTAFSTSGSMLKFDVLASEILNVGYYDLVVRIERTDGSIRGGKSTVTIDKRRFLKIVPHDELITDD